MKCICGLCMAFENFLGLFLFFLRSLIPKKSSGMQKPYVWLVTPPTKNQHKNSILVHRYKCCWTKKGIFQNYYPVKFESSLPCLEWVFNFSKKLQIYENVLEKVMPYLFDFIIFSKTFLKKYWNDLASLHHDFNMK